MEPDKVYIIRWCFVVSVMVISPYRCIMNLYRNITRLLKKHTSFKDHLTGCRYSRLERFDNILRNSLRFLSKELKMKRTKEGNLKTDTGTIHKRRENICIFIF